MREIEHRVRYAQLRISDYNCAAQLIETNTLVFKTIGDIICWVSTKYSLDVSIMGTIISFYSVEIDEINIETLSFASIYDMRIVEE